MADSHDRSDGVDPRAILVRGVNWIGDAVMTTPAVRRLRQRFPAARMVLLTHEKLRDLWLDHPDLDRIVTFSSGETPWAVGRRLRSENLDLAMLFPNSVRSALEAWWARIPARVGYAHSWRTWLLTQPVPRRLGHSAMRKKGAREVRRLVRRSGRRAAWPEAAHQVHEYLHLAGALGATTEPSSPFLEVKTETLRSAAEKFALTGAVPGARPLFGLNPGAEYGPAKRWPTDRFAQVAVEVHRRVGCVWLLTGGTSDVAAVRSIETSLREAGVPTVNVAGRTTLREFCALLRLCRVVLTNDTGPMHMAAAVGTPVVVLFGSTSPELTGPGLPGDARHHLLIAPDIPCAPCFRRECPIDFRCLKTISTEQVAAAVLAAANAGQHPPSGTSWTKDS